MTQMVMAPYNVFAQAIRLVGPDILSVRPIIEPTVILALSNSSPSIIASFSPFLPSFPRASIVGFIRVCLQTIWCVVLSCSRVPNIDCSRRWCSLEASSVLIAHSKGSRNMVKGSIALCSSCQTHNIRKIIYECGRLYISKDMVAIAASLFLRESDFRWIMLEPGGFSVCCTGSFLPLASFAPCLPPCEAQCYATYLLPRCVPGRGK